MKNCIAGNFLILFLLALLSCENTAYKSQIEFDAISLENETNRDWTQGWLSVKENRIKRKSNSIQLPFVLSKVADSLKTLNAPVLVMSGGPGNSSLHMANGFTRSPVGFRGDILVMDQRGTYYSKPFLKCSEIDSARLNGIKSGNYGKKLDDLHLAAVKKCYDRWTKSGVDLNGYHTLESVQDIEDLRSLLEIDKLILYGMSYSCKLMAAYANTFPDRVEALVLDSPLPHDSNYDEEAYAAMDKIFRDVLNHHSENKELYPNWTSYIESIQDSVFSMEVDSMDLRYTSSEVIDAAMNLLGDHSSLEQLPAIVEGLMRGDHNAVGDVLKYYLGTGRQAKGMRYSTWIAEELPDESPERIKNNREAIHWLKDYPVNDISFETAKYWKVKSIFESRAWPDKSYNGPVMVLSGAFDPWTPVAYGQKMKEKFPQAKLEIYPETTHLPGFTNQGATDIFEFLKEL